MRFLTLHVNSYLSARLLRRDDQKCLKSYQEPDNVESERRWLCSRSIEKGDEQNPSFSCSNARAGKIAKLTSQHQSDHRCPPPVCASFCRVGLPRSPLSTLQVLPSKGWDLPSGYRQFGLLLVGFSSLRIDAKGHPLSTGSTDCDGGKAKKT
jgi:hypothetical protein